eukprot:TRINITY_DN10642_c0_g1_i1.p1 TRINITY_DN10642_c0_g1~~TRINITY_DN10642_c0_g1_i1.p1  ORF type:complete len:598 (-),score=77.38 TRINITY_DN10642_c0_g1_i1:98-1891(-)
MSLVYLPAEIIERILLSSCLNRTDITNFSLTCKRFHDCAQNNEIWRELFKRGYPSIMDKLTGRDLTDVDWKNQFKRYAEISEDAISKICTLSKESYKKRDLSNSDFKDFDNILLQKNPTHDFSHIYLTHSIRERCNQSNQLTDLTLKYYGRKVLTHISHRLQKQEVQDFMEMAISKQQSSVSYEMYERTLIMIASWCQPHKDISHATIKRRLDAYAQNIFDMLKHKGIIDVTIVKDLTTLRKMVKSREVEAAILDTTNNFLEMEGFNGNSDNYYLPDNSYIDRILETKLGIPISLSLLYLCLVGRLGVKVEPVNFPRHFLLKWEEHPAANSNDKKFAYIDVFHKGKRLKESETADLLPPVGINLEPSYFHVASPLHTAHRMLRNLIAIGSSSTTTSRDPSYTLLRAALELMLELNDGAERADLALMLVRVYLQLSINHEEVEMLCEKYRDDEGQVDFYLSHCQAQKQALEGNDEIVPKKRQNEEFPYGELRFRVGQIAKHKLYNYTCVVYGWDKKCTASQSWIYQMRVNKLPKKDTQPFYNVLVTDGSERYAADENLEPCQPEIVTHPQIGKYFKAFDSSRGYLPNDELLKEYPDDV